MKSINNERWVSCKPVHCAIVQHSFRKLCCRLHSVLISSGSQCVSVWSRLEAQFQIASLQSGLQTLARLGQKHPPRPSPCLELGFRLSHGLSISFYILPLLYSRGPRWWCKLCLRDCDSTNLITFRCFVETFYKGKIPEPQLLFLCVVTFFGPLQHCSDFPLIPCWVLVIWTFCLWPQWEQTCRLWGLLLYLAYLFLISELADANP